MIPANIICLPRIGVKEGVAGKIGISMG